MSVLPGEPLDGSGRVCVHLFVQDEKGLITEPHVLHHTPSGVVAKPTKGRIACDSRLKVKPVTIKGVTKITFRSDDPRAVTCPGCISSEFYKSMMAKLSPPNSQ